MPDARSLPSSRTPVPRFNRKLPSALRVRETGFTISNILHDLYAAMSIHTSPSHLSYVRSSKYMPSTQLLANVISSFSLLLPLDPHGEVGQTTRAWSDPHNNGTYTLLADSNPTGLPATWQMQRVTGDQKYTDLINFVFSVHGDNRYGVHT